MSYAANPNLFPLIREPASRWERSGLTPEQERRFNVTLWVLLALFAVGYIFSVTQRVAAPPGTDPLDPTIPGLNVARDGPERPATATERITRGPLGSTIAPRLTEALLQQTAQRYASTLPREFRGLSGNMYVHIVPPGEDPALPSAETGALTFRREGGAAAARPSAPGVWNVVLQASEMVSPVPNLSVITMVPMSAKVNGRIGRFRIGDWPCEVGRCPSNPIYRTPPGLIEMTPQNREMFLSKHIQLKHFQTKLQDNVWPKYVVVNPKVVDKVELVLQEIDEMGHPVRHIFAVSGFRSPWYNASGGNTAGRGQLSRHMYGDAMDIAIDNDRNGLMDDLNGDGRINLADARIIGQAVDRVERKYPSMVGGMHYYPPTGGHRGMVHIDTRGNRARW
jgi:uncharacterized protein YcbK (DUF882 family)